MSRHHRTLTVLLVATLSTGVIACSSSDSGVRSAPPTSAGADPSTASPDTTPPSETSDGSGNTDTTGPATTTGDGSDAPVSADVGVLAAAGMSIVEREDQPVDPSVTDAGHLMITTLQAQRMVADVRPGSGILGSDVDAMIPLPADVPPLSYFVAGWVSGGNSAAAQAARTWMGDQDWTHAPSVRFPIAVMAMFVTEMSIGTSGEMAPLASPLPVPTGDEVQSSGFRAGGFGRSATVLASGPCTAVTQFIAQAITGIFNALRITPPSGDGLLGSIGQVLAGAFNLALGLAQSVIEGLVSTITAPVLGAIAIAVGALGVVTLVASYFKDTTLNLRLAPPPPAPVGYRFAVEQEPDISGDFVATAKDLTGDWPPVLKDCAAAAGASLPELLPVGSPAEWTVQENGLITTGAKTTTVEADRSTRLRFTTGRESQEAADKGAAMSNAATATVRIPRQEIDSILDFARSKVSDAQASILNKVPAAARAAATEALNSVVNPTLDQLQGEISKTVGGVFTLSGTTSVFVVHHGTPDTTTSSSEPETVPPDTSAEDDFCTQFQALVDFTRNNPPGDVVAWATEIVDRLQTMRPSAPAELVADVDVMIRVYQAVAASADVLVLIQTTEPLPDAVAASGAFCGLSGVG